MKFVKWICFFFFKVCYLCFDPLFRRFSSKHIPYLHLCIHKPHVAALQKVRWSKLNLDQCVPIQFLWSFILQTFLTYMQLFVHHPQCLKSLIFLSLYWVRCLKKKYKIYITYNSCLIQSVLLGTWNKRKAGIIFSSTISAVFIYKRSPRQ